METSDEGTLMITAIHLICI